MCAAGGGSSELNRLRLPFDPNEVVRGSGESFISDDTFSPFVNHAAVGYPAFTIPQLHFWCYFFDGDKSCIRQNKLSFGDTGQFRNFAFLAQMPVHAVLFHRDAEHLRS